MLKLKNIKKDYLSGDNTVHALKGIDLEFRKSEFVSILGQSGCGKTTLLNIIGGLDRYTSGDLIINGKSTKDFKDRDWDAYRNYSIGFVFQNYNLISHQTVLSNVELALTLDGVKKEERRKRAIKALEEVGLKDQINKRPNQLSGGQMQRVAIARALVNNPDIILADEPTGALDTETSVQVMEILKEISKDRLIIMVTHNPDLANKYSSRIIKVLDGKVIDDSNPYDSEKEKKKKAKEDKKKKPSMSFFTALSLSLNNLMTKKGRTFLTAFAGSIGIIGIALIMSLSSGVQEYINKVEEDTLSSYPITITKESIQLNEMMETMMSEELDDIEKLDKNAEKIYSHNIMGNIFTTLTAKVKTNNLEAFKNHLETKDTEINNASNAIQYSYDLNINLYKENTDNGILQVNPSQVMPSLGYEMTGEATQMMMMSTDVWIEMLDNEELIKSQYDILAGRFPEKYNEVILIVDEYNRVSDYMLYTLGLLDMAELQENYQTLLEGGTIEKGETLEYTFDEMLDLKYKLVLNTDYYEKVNNIWVNKSTDEAFMKNMLANAEDISIVGIVRVNPESVVTASTGMIGYTVDLKEYVINKVNESEIAKEQKANPEVNVLTGIPFSQTAGMSAVLTEEEKAYISTLSPEEQASIMAQYSNVQAITYENVLRNLGIIDLNSPVAINIYPKDFESKDIITLAIDKYNNKQEEVDQIKYTDVVGTLMSSVTSIVNTISYVLIAFVAISLIVSSIMIGIITYISVLERTKEIGILRAIGASKKDISRVFNAETLIIGLSAGLLGIGVTLLLNIPINMVIKHFTGISNLSVLPIKGAIGLVLISMVLTIISGFIPAKVAAKKDPVEALRTE